MMPPGADFSEEQLAIAADFHDFNYAFCQEQAFDVAKGSAFLSICKTIFAADTATNDPAKPVAASFAELQRLLLMHAVERPPKCVGVFSRADVEAIVEHMLNGYYRHWRLYKYVFTPQLQVTFHQAEPFRVEAPLAPRPLHDALPHELDAPPPAPTPAASRPDTADGELGPDGEPLPAAADGDEDGLEPPAEPEPDMAE